MRRTAPAAWSVVASEEVMAHRTLSHWLAEGPATAPTRCAQLGSRA